MTRTTLLSSLLILGAACTSGTVDPVVVGALNDMADALRDACNDGLLSEPSLRQRLVAFDGKVSTIEVWFEAAAATKDNSIEVRSITLGDKGPRETLPFVLGPVAGGGRATARFNFEGVSWRGLSIGHQGDPLSYEAVFANELATSHAMAQGSTKVTSTSRASMGILLEPGEPGHDLLAGHLAKAR